jgi:pimeloyl-ACP methyl ester carboxylesterase
MLLAAELEIENAQRIHNQIFAGCDLASRGMRGMLLIAAVVGLLGGPPAANASRPTPARTQRRLIRYRAHDGKLRRAWLLLPAGYQGQPIPLVISPHGRGVGALQNAARWGDLPAEGDFAVINPAGQGRRLQFFSWGDPGEIADLARMPAIVEAHGVNVDPQRIYAIGGSMGGQETLLLVARYPHLLAGAAAFDPPTDMARRYRDFAALPYGRTLQRLAREEIGGTPATDPRAYALRSPDHYARRLAASGVPLQIYWSTRDQIIDDQTLEAGALADEIRELNPFAQLWDFEGEWRHTAEMQPDRRLPRALARFDLLPWADAPPVGPGGEVRRGPGTTPAA